MRPLTAELWDGPASAAVAAFEFVKARITGKKPNLGENRKVTVRMTRTSVPRKSAIAARKRPSTTYRIIWKAIRARKQIVCSYEHHPREVFAHILGYKASGEEALFVFQVGGESSKPLPPAGEWRCFDLDGIADIQVRERSWRGGSRHRRRKPASGLSMSTSTCRRRLTRPQPLAFGSSALRPPRQPGE